MEIKVLSRTPYHRPYCVINESYPASRLLVVATRGRRNRSCSRVEGPPLHEKQRRCAITNHDLVRQ
jgi:hypothetical protein